LAPSPLLWSSVSAAGPGPSAVCHWLFRRGASWARVPATRSGLAELVERCCLAGLGCPMACSEPSRLRLSIRLGAVSVLPPGARNLIAAWRCCWLAPPSRPVRCSGAPPERDCRGAGRTTLCRLGAPWSLARSSRRSNQSLQLPGRPSRAEALTARSAAFGGALLAKVVSLLVWRAVVAGGPQLSSTVRPRFCPNPLNQRGLSPRLYFASLASGRHQLLLRIGRERTLNPRRISPELRRPTPL
jgi:hypothetical protein